MFAVMLRHLWRARTQTIVTLLLAMLIVLLVSVPSAIRDSAIDKPQNYLRNSGADVYAAQSGVHDYISASVMSYGDTEAIKAIPGVSDVQGVHLMFTTIKAGDRLERGVIQSYRVKKDFGGPWKLAEGRPPEQSGEVAIDKGFKQSLAVDLGGSINLGGHDYTVVGFSDETAAIGKQLVFMTVSDVEQYLLGGPGLLNFILVKTDRPAEVRDAIKALGLSAFTRDEFVDQNHDYWQDQIAPSMNMVIYVTVICGVIMVLLATFQSVRSRQRYFGVSKANGVSTFRLASMEFGKLIVASLVGIVIGVAISPAIISVVNSGSAGLDAALSSSIISSAVLIMATVSVVSVIPAIISLVRIDPGLAIKEAV